VCRRYARRYGPPCLSRCVHGASIGGGGGGAGAGEGEQIADVLGAVGSASAQAGGAPATSRHEEGLCAAMRCVRAARAGGL
jgi:type IV secretory pathway TrbL component